MKERLLEILSCPDCGGDFRLINGKSSEGEITSGQLRCSVCDVEYPILKGIPRILTAPEVNDNYSRNFQYYWRKMDWHRPNFNKERFFELTEWKPEDIHDKYVLDAGCGGGRWLYQFAEEGAKEIVAFDYTLAVERAQEICSKFKNIHYLQADIYKMPFRDNLFDIVHCHGVLMATPDPRKGVENLAKKVAPEGELAILLYRNLTWVQKVIDDTLCGITKRLPPGLVFYLTLIPTVIEYLPGAVWLLENIFHLSGQPNFTLKHLHNFDWYSCAYRHRNSPGQVSQWLQNSNFSDIKILNTNDFRVRSGSRSIQKLKEYLLEHGFFLKATLGIRAKKSREGVEDKEQAAELDAWSNSSRLQKL